MIRFGLIGRPLTHSFSKKYFSEKFQKENISGYEYDLYELESIEEFPALLKNTENLKGINVTIPYKEQVIPFLDRLDPNTAGKINAVNVVKVEEDGTLTGYNSDYIGFKESLLNFIPDNGKGMKALILGTGGASKAIIAVMEELEIPYLKVSRSKSEDTVTYQDLNEEIMSLHTLVINTTPLGTYPKEDTFPALPYELLTKGHYAYDLVYNPSETTFMKKFLEKGGKAKNGLQMLVGQAEASWTIWQKKG